MIGPGRPLGEAATPPGGWRPPIALQWRRAPGLSWFCDSLRVEQLSLGIVGPGRGSARCHRRLLRLADPRRRWGGLHAHDRRAGTCTDQRPALGPRLGDLRARNTVRSRGQRTPESLLVEPRPTRGFYLARSHRWRGHRAVLRRNRRWMRGPRTRLDRGGYALWLGRRRIVAGMGRRSIHPSTVQDDVQSTLPSPLDGSRKAFSGFFGIVLTARVR
jgi:hypothetical protein